MQLVTFPDWPYPVRFLLTLAQQLANARGHATVSPAHFNAVLFQMKPVADLLGPAATESKIEAALLVEPRASMKKAVLFPGVHAVLRGDGEKTTARFLRTYAAAHAIAAPLGLEIAAHADAIASLLELPLFCSLMSDARGSETARICPAYVNGLIGAANRGHAQVTCRHVVLVALCTMQKVLRKRELTPIDEEVIAKLEELVARSTPKRAEGEKNVGVAPKLAGVMLALAKEGEGAFRAKMFKTCADGDDALDDAIRAMHDANARAREAKNEM